MNAHHLPSLVRRSRFALAAAAIVAAFIASGEMSHATIAPPAIAATLTA